jgi:hypothetical protein
MTFRPPDFESLLARLTEDIDLTLAQSLVTMSRSASSGTRLAR